MAHVKDPVCGMMVDPDAAAGRSTHDGVEYSFCSVGCLEQFEANPASFVGPSAKPTSRVADDAAVPLEQHDQTYTKAGGMVAPRFGSAGSGGAEFERLPERHDKH